MTTLITAGNSEGSRRCDARCYNAKGPKCDCICGGRNHGAGLQQAGENTREMAEEWLSQMAEVAAGIYVGAVNQQLELVP